MAKQTQIFYKRMYPCVCTTVNSHCFLVSLSEFIECKIKEEYVCDA
jgi:hypothetical protein